jgi:ribokinase
MQSLNIDTNNYRYQAMIGVGGIGSGKFFLLDGNQTLGREESRSGQFLDTRDYCKLHIISHYVQILLGREFKVIPVGKIGKDEIGRTLVREMADIGMCLDYVKETEDSPTLFSFCFLYPDGSGGNMTTNDSACARVDTTFVAESESIFIKHAGRGIGLAVSEVPLEARTKLLQMATNHGFFRIASFNSEEMKRVIASGIIQNIDLLAINLDEAAAATGMVIGEHESKSIVESAVNILTTINSDLQLSITHGKEGCWTWDGEDFSYVLAHEVSVKSAAGAGDAHLAGIIAGLTAGLSLKEAQQLGALMGAHSVTSPHTINPDTNRKTLKSLANSSAININNHVRQLLED